MKTLPYPRMLTYTVLTTLTLSTHTVFAQDAAEAFNLLDWAEMFGRFHPVVLHFPIGLLAGVFLQANTVVALSQSGFIFLVIGCNDSNAHNVLQRVSVARERSVM